ncbi:hypothetical protein JNK13_05650 [bacterium]|nr:hypothetical protein [bacterium]
MAQSTPTFQDAELTLRLYDLRRETVMRESRNLLNGKFWPKSYEDFAAITKPDHQLNAAFRQVSGYWEMAYSMARHGIAHADFLAENNAEGLFFYAKIYPYIEQFRKDVSPTAFTNTEWITKNSNVARQRLETIQKRLSAMMEMMQSMK